MSARCTRDTTGENYRATQKKSESLSLSDDPDHSTSRRISGLEEIPSPPESAILEEHSPQPNNDLALFDSHMPVESSASTVEENPQHVSPVPEPFTTDEKAVSTNELVTTPEEITTGSASSIISSSSPEADTQPECPDQTYPLVACTHPVSTVDPTDSTLSPNASGHTLEVSQQTSLDTPNQTTSTHCPASHDSTIRSPSITSQTKYRPVSKETQELYLDSDATSTISGILRTSVKYHEKTADFQDGDCLVTKVTSILISSHEARHGSQSVARTRRRHKSSGIPIHCQLTRIRRALPENEVAQQQPTNETSIETSSTNFNKLICDATPRTLRG
ncbi:hypothetical protein BKA65DRAFT_474254 [Rhexocercosporidium sp. MPI-PUGE-AT-0058]|nr:hypothetical protein BKA65DRAFT_474254 [Rhexocercosporidium sp. MPI-PUGE-AT-0058]